MSVHLIIMGAALLCFLFAAIMTKSAEALGLFFLTLAMLLATTK